MTEGWINFSKDEWYCGLSVRAVNCLLNPRFHHDRVSIKSRDSLDSREKVITAIHDGRLIPGERIHLGFKTYNEIRAWAGFSPISKKPLLCPCCGKEIQIKLKNGVRFITALCD